MIKVAGTKRQNALLNTFIIMCPVCASHFFPFHKHHGSFLHTFEGLVKAVRTIFQCHFCLSALCYFQIVSTYRGNASNNWTGEHVCSCSAVLTQANKSILSFKRGVNTSKDQRFSALGPLD